jgi:hypothetical protein
MVTLTRKMSDIGPQTIQGLPLRPESYGMVGVIDRRSAQSVFIDGKITSDVYLSLLSDELGSLLMGYVIPTNSAWFQRDGARRHTINVGL